MCALHISVSQLLWCCKSSIYSNLCNNDAINEPGAGWMEPLCLAAGTWLIGTPFHDPGCQSLHHQVSRRPAKRLQTREEVARLTMTVAETNPLVLKTTVWCAWQLLHNVIQVSAHFYHQAADCNTGLPLLYKSPRPRPPPPVPGGKTKWLSAWNGCSVYLCMGSRLLIIISQENETHGALKNQQDWICCASLLSEYQTRL